MAVGKKGLFYELKAELNGIAGKLEISSHDSLYLLVVRFLLLCRLSPIDLNLLPLSCVSPFRSCCLKEKMRESTQEMKEEET